MKTVIDAVNEFKGDWENAEYGEIDVRFIFECFNNKDVTNSIGALVGDCENGSPENYREVCTRKQFNDLVSQMETNFGKCEQSYSDYVMAFVSMDDLNKSFSDKELEVMDIVLLMGNRYEFSDDKNDWEEGELYDYSDEPVQTKQYQSKSGDKTEWYLYIREIKPQPKPVFTQEMCDNKILPPIGSKAQFIGNDDYLVEFNISDGDEVECICHTKDFEGESIGVYRHKDGYSVSILTQLIKPLTPPIELIDGNWYLVKKNYGSEEERVLHRNRGTWFYDVSKFPDNANDDWTVISKLTVEVK